MKRPALVLSCLLIAVGAVVLLTSRYLRGDNPQAENVSSGRRYEPSVQGIGFIEPVSEVRKLAFKINGIIARCPAEIARSYKKGDVLMELGNAEQVAEVAVAEGELALAEADRDKVLSGVNKHQIEAAASKVDLLREQVRFRKKEYDRARDLSAKRSLSNSEFDRIQTDHLQGEAELRQSEAELLHLENFVRTHDRSLAEAKYQLAKARLELAKQRYEDTMLRAPFDGVVLEIFRREGEGSRLFDPEPVALYGDPSQLRVRVELDERFVFSVQKGQKALIIERGPGGRSYAAEVTSVRAIMGKKTVFSRSATERKDLDVIQLMVEPKEPLNAPIGLEVDVKILTGK